MPANSLLSNKIAKPIAFITLCLPLAWLISGMLMNSLGANPIEYLIRSLGEWALIILLLTLTVSPLSRLSKLPRLIQFRRMIGLFAFFYASLHVASYLVFEQSLNIKSVLSDIWERPFIAAGFVAFLCLIPLAATSTKAKIRQMGKRWKLLHRVIYLAVILGVLHYWWLVKVDVSNPAVFAALTIILLSERIWQWLRHNKKI